MLGCICLKEHVFVATFLCPSVNTPGAGGSAVNLVPSPEALPIYNQ